MTIILYPSMITIKADKTIKKKKKIPFRSVDYGDTNNTRTINDPVPHRGHLNIFL